ncbi:MAG: glycoside hydrolase family 3 C-terminal domain-containing protein, partial [Propionibacteriaceae bacterium]|nr:glycoside hydrolase family 3 C-terminal domain-containing protein [Propionibacteriaceae bacterium]
MTVSLSLTSPAMGAVSATTDPSPNAMETSHAALSQQAATEGMVLLENDGALPVAKGNIAIFGLGSLFATKGGTGSGAVNQRSVIQTIPGFEAAGYTVTTNASYLASLGTQNAGGTATGTEQPLTDETVQPTAPTTTAIYVVTRNSGEGSDRHAVAGDYFLSATEQANLELIAQTYPNVVVLMNVPGQTDTNFFHQINATVKDPDGGQALDALMLISQGGENFGAAVAQVVSGEVSPSGKLVDTWASDYSYYPASATFGANDGNTTTEQYSEGIYVGYRYFDSFYKTINPSDPASVVSYPFGYGLSYTTFSMKTLSVTADADNVTVKVAVTNTGTRAGKQVVEVYYSAPTGLLDKPYQELGGYAKTDTLAPGQCQVVTVSYKTTDMASFNAFGAKWVMEQGDYLVRVGDSSRDTTVAAKIHLASTVTTELDDNVNDSQAPDTELVSNPSDFYSYADQAAQIAAAPTVTLDPTSITTQDDRSPFLQTGTVGPDSPYYALDHGNLSTVNVYLDPANPGTWTGTLAPYQADPTAAYQPKAGENVVATTTSSGNTLYDVYAGKITMQQFVAGLSVDQLAHIVEGGTGATPSTPSATGAAGYTTALYEALGIPGMALSDGPAGLRLTQSFTSGGTTYYQWCTAWPVGTMLAQTWNRDLIEQVGAGVGEEMNYYGVTMWLAPGMNIHRDPLNGRNFEYYSEDPLVAGLSAAAMTTGVQSNPGVGVTLKHFFGNNQEVNRNSVNDLISQRAQREIYLKGFEIAVKSAQPMAIMTSYNKTNGTWSSQNYDLITNILVGEWGFKGVVMTDWGGSHDPIATMYAGNDLIEPGGAPQNIENNLVNNTTTDIDGLPVRSINTRGAWSWSLGNFTLSASGATTLTNHVDASVIGKTAASTSSSTASAATGAPYASVQDAYNWVSGVVANPTGYGLTATQGAAIAITDVVRDDDGNVASFDVTLQGNWPASFAMRLGDVQRSAIDILHVAMQTNAFASLAKLQGVSGVTARPYTAQFTDLTTFVASSASAIVSPGATVSISTQGTTTNGWHSADTTVTASVSDPAYTIGLSVDGAPGTNPATLTTDGVHNVVATATCADCSLQADTATAQVKVDKTAPTVTPTLNGATLTLTATDATSGVASIQYSADAGTTWQTYTDPIDLSQGSVLYRATDQAGNVSQAQTAELGQAPEAPTGGGSANGGSTTGGSTAGGSAPTGGSVADGMPWLPALAGLSLL